MKQELEFKIEGKEWVSLQDAAFNKLNKKAKIDGFRPGKAPREIFEKNNLEVGLIEVDIEGFEQNFLTNKNEILLETVHSTTGATGNYISSPVIKVNTALDNTLIIDNTNIFLFDFSHKIT